MAVKIHIKTLVNVPDTKEDHISDILKAALLDLIATCEESKSDNVEVTIDRLVNFQKTISVDRDRLISYLKDHPIQLPNRDSLALLKEEIASAMKSSVQNIPGPKTFRHRVRAWFRCENKSILLIASLLLLATNVVLIILLVS